MFSHAGSPSSSTFGDEAHAQVLQRRGYPYFTALLAEIQKQVSAILFQDILVNSRNPRKLKLFYLTCVNIQGLTFVTPFLNGNTFFASVYRTTMGEIKELS